MLQSVHDWFVVAPARLYLNIPQGLLDLGLAAGIGRIHRRIPCERVSVDSAIQSDGVFGDEPPHSRINVSGAIIVQLSLGIIVPPGELPHIRNAAGVSPLNVPKGVVAVLIIE